jgi:hypothetical protein
MNASTNDTSDLAAQIRSELADHAPQGFHFNDHVIRQDAALDRLVERLKALDDSALVAGAASQAMTEERDGWTLLKILELVERLELVGTAPALMKLAQSGREEDDRSKFLAGRASEVLLKLPLDYQTRLQANEVTKGPLQDVVRFRMGADKERALHRPRRAEWTLLVVLMVVFLVGLFVAFRAG